jgi:hypothetical protein
MKALFAKFATRKAKILAALVGLGFATLVSAQVYYGFNPVTGLTVVQGIPVAGGNKPVVSGSTCGTLTQVGGAGTFTVAGTATTCTIVVTFPSAAPNGYFCVFADETHPADIITQASHTSTSCTSTAATVTAADVILIEVNGF